MPEDERQDDGVETGEGSAGAPETLDSEAARDRWSSRRPIPDSELDERQRRIGARRRHGGPDLHAETEARDDLEDDAGGGSDPTEPEPEDEG
jgi:hypothetical protein